MAGEAKGQKYDAAMATYIAARRAQLERRLREQRGMRKREASLVSSTSLVAHFVLSFDRWPVARERKKAVLLRLHFSA